MPIDRSLSITTSVTQLLGINHPILLAPMDHVADGRLAAAVHAAGGFGILSGGYGEEKWLERELDVLDRSKARLIWSMNGTGDPKESMTATGLRSKARLRSLGCFARLHVMKPMPNGAEHDFSLAVSCSSQFLSP